MSLAGGCLSLGYKVAWGASRVAFCLSSKLNARRNPACREHASLICRRRDKSKPIESAPLHWHDQIQLKQFSQKPHKSLLMICRIPQNSNVSRWVPDGHMQKGTL